MLVSENGKQVVTGSSHFILLSKRGNSGRKGSKFSREVSCDWYYISTRTSSHPCFSFERMSQAASNGYKSSSMSRSRSKELQRSPMPMA